MCVFFFFMDACEFSRFVVGFEFGGALLMWGGPTFRVLNRYMCATWFTEACSWFLLTD